jgi:2-C-methyl-D-erythritol 4-phosphate cytidylyltransferase
MNKVSAIIVAAGEGKRFGEAKQFALLKGKKVLDWVLEKFEYHEAIDNIILVLGNDQAGDEYLGKYGKIGAIAKGGKRRQDSVYSGLGCMDTREAGIVLVHDGARPLVGKDLIQRIVDTVKIREAVVPVVPMEDTIKRVAEKKVLRTEERGHLFRVQTPQGFSFSLLREAHARALKDQFEGTDEAALVERLGKDVFVIPGERRNLKITTQEDMKIAEALIED